MTAVATELSVTLDQVLGWGPCYEEDQVRELWGDRERVTAREILACDAIPIEDRLWYVLRPELVPTPILHRFACMIATWALDHVESRGRAVDPRSRAGIATKLRWLDGEATDEELAAASSASWAASSASWAASSASSASWAASSASSASWAAWAASSATWAASSASSASWAASSASRAASSAAARAAARAAAKDILLGMML